jgi:DNA replication and repair protein RecF
VEIKALKLQNWRSHKDFEFEFNVITVLVGPTAIGKTNFLEAVYYLSTGKSFRAKDENLIGWDEQFTRLDGEIVNSEGAKGIAVILESINSRAKKTVKIKDQKVASAKLLGELSSVIFTPEEIELISNLPEARRRYLNLVISQSDRKYAINLLHFKKALEQRNALLRRIKEGQARASELEVWDGKLAEYAEYLIIARDSFITEINKTVSGHYRKLSGDKEELQLEYLPSINPRGGWSGIVLSLTQNRENDIFARVTTKGPHRDDFAFKIDGRNVLTFASRGELRTIILALKMAELDFIEKVRGERPVLLLDDVYSELDAARRDLLSQLLSQQQTIITTTDLDHVSKKVLEKARVIKL